MIGRNSDLQDNPVMPLLLEHIEQGYANHVTCVDPWNLDDAHTILGRILEYMNTIDFTVHGVVDVTQTRHVPSGIMTLDIESITGHPRCGFIVLYGGATLVRAQMQLVFRLEQFKRFYMVDTLEQAITFVRDAVASES
jgi:hypothetical protein